MLSKALNTAAFDRISFLLEKAHAGITVVDLINEEDLFKGVATTRNATRRVYAIGKQRAKMFAKLNDVDLELAADPWANNQGFYRPNENYVLTYRRKMFGNEFAVYKQQCIERRNKERLSKTRKRAAPR